MRLILVLHEIYSALAMKPEKGSRRVCPEGHVYYKSSDCPACPKCESARQPEAGFMLAVAAPARRALEGAGIKTLKQLAKYSEKEILALHGIGKTAIPRLKAALEKSGLHFKA
jgi:predicted RecB family nuclease